MRTMKRLEWRKRLLAPGFVFEPMPMIGPRSTSTKSSQRAQTTCVSRRATPEKVQTSPALRPLSGDEAARSSLQHESVEERGELGIVVERKNMGDILVRPHDDRAPTRSIDAPQIENIGAALQVRAEHLLIVAESKTALTRQEESGHCFDSQFAMALLEYRPDIDCGVDIRSGRSVPRDRRARRLGEKLAQSSEPRGRSGGVRRIGEREYPPPAVRLDGVAEVNRLGVGEADHRRRMKAHADREALGEMLIDRLAGNDRRGVAGFRSGGEARLLDEVSLELRRIHAFVAVEGIFRRRAEHSGPLAIEVDQLLGDALTFGRIGAQDLGRASPTQDRRQFPAEVEGVLHRDVHALSGFGAVGMAGVAGDERPREAVLRWRLGQIVVPVA